MESKFDQDDIVEVNVPLFKEVKDGLDKKSTLRYDDSVVSLTCCLQNTNSEDVISFLKQCLLRMVSILLDQNPSKIGVFERSRIEDSLDLALKILIKLLRSEPTMLDALVRMFNKSATYYAGSRTSWTNYPGDPHTRLSIIIKFSELGGFSVIRDLLKDPDLSWLGADKLNIILLALNEADGGVLSELSGEIADEVMRQVMALSEDRVKKESTDNLGAMIKSLLSMKNKDRLKRYYEFWLNHTLKMMNCGSIVLKLFAWDQMHEIIREAIATRPPPRRYLVRNAGTEEVNGIYTSTFKLGDTPSYEKGPVDEEGKLFTLFRCTMRSKQKWWFISVADLEKPGTDKDVDYYQHKSHADQEMEPPTLGWALATGSRSPSVDPPPVLCRLEAIEDDDGRPIDCLIDSLLSWSHDNRLLEKVFGQSVHREILSRSKNLLMLLGETDRLNSSDIEMIWKVGTQNSAEDGQEVFSLLASTSLHFSDACFDVLHKLACESLQSGNMDYINHVVELVENMNEEGAKYVRSLSTHAKSRVIDLVWTLYNTPGIETNKSHSSIEDMLSLCLRFYRKGDQVLTYLRECSDALLNYRSSDDAVDESRISRLIHTLTFILNQHADPSLDEVLSESGFYRVLVAELERYMSLHVVDCEVTPHVISQIAHRLSLVRCAYGMSTRIKMDRDALDKLWQLFTTPLAREQMFVFLRNAGVKQGHMESVYSITECFHVFRAMLCSDAVDWSECGDDAFQCFSVYFTGLSNRSEFDDETRSGAINTLWNITLRIPSDSSACEAIALLLKAYADVELYDSESNSQLLCMIFDELKAANSNCATTGLLSSSLRVAVSRCTDLLSNIITKATQSLSSGKSSATISFTPHAVKGNVFRIKVFVRYRVVSHHSHHANTFNKRQTVDSSNSKIAVIELHSMHSLHVLKQKINAVACTLQMRVNVDFDSTLLVGDSYPVSHFGIHDGCELVATLTQQSAVSSVYDDDDYNDMYYTNRTSRFDGSTELSVRRLASITTEENFDCILRLIDTLDHHSMNDLTKGLWSLLMVVPTQSSILDRIEGLFDCADEGWACILETPSSSAATYKLQIVDYILQPAPEVRQSDSGEAIRKSQFISGGGFGTVLSFFVSAGGDDRNGKLSLAISLHILHYCLFDPVTGEASPGLISQVQESSGAVLEKLLTVAYNAALADESGIVQNALGMITALLKSPSIASQLTCNPKARNLLTAVLRSASKTVRDMAAEFAVQVGKSQPVVMQWLLVELESISPGELNCYEIFKAFCILVEQVGEVDGEVDLFAICDSVSRKLLQFKGADVYPPTNSDRSMLLGCLELLRQLIKMDGSAVVQTELGEVLVEIFFNNFLFAMPVDGGRDCSPVCDTPDTRRAAFAVLVVFIELSPKYLLDTLDRLQVLTRSSAAQMKNTWGLQVSHDLRRPNIQFSGLKNQGCTCYLNSLIQQLFMSKSFRDVVMRSPIRNSLRSSLWHVSSDDLVGKEFLFEWSSGEWKLGRITAYTAGLSHHTIQYDGRDGSADEVVSLNIHSGRPHKETGRVKPVPLPGTETLSDREATAVAVLEQLQRTFCFMEKSKKRYFDPRPFIESCKSLNLNFNIYHQNDASEFCDQLLDRLETAMKGKCTQTDMWKLMMEQVFGGKMLYQKIPKDCEKFSVDRRDCGHWQSTRSETFLKAELLIRGKESIEEGLAQVIEGELMDGDNKIMCDTCNQKKDTVRRTCFGKLPKMLILHLKRFDLDFTTFETVKLNSRISFPTNISMFKYTKEGIEASEKADADGNKQVFERRESKQQEGETPQNHSEEGRAIDMVDYEYELQGVLVHSGIAQGGHYYSFIRADDNLDNWFLFDDDDVSPFNPDNIPSQCFGGTYQTSLHGMSNMIEEDRSSNALMLFYNKVRASELIDYDEDEERKLEMSDENADGQNSAEECTNGYEAFDREVGESNLRHALANYLVDPGLHSFVRTLIRSMYDSTYDYGSPPDSPASGQIRTTNTPAHETVMATVKFGTLFLLDVVLHCRERSGTKQWCAVLQNAFEIFPETAKWFIKYILGENCTVLQEYLLRCADALSRLTFVQLIGHAVNALCPADWPADCLLEYANATAGDIVRTMKANPSGVEAVLVLLVRQVIKILPEATLHLRTCDELFALIRELAIFPPLCSYMVNIDLVAQICYFVIPDKVPPAMREIYSSTSSRYVGADSKPFHPVIFEVIAALLGVPQSQKVNLLNEKANIWEPELTEDATNALSLIFKECSHYGGMDSRDIITYMERVHASDETAPKVTALQVRSILDRYDTLADGRLSLGGFLRYYADTALYQPKSVWKHLRAFSFQNDLSRTSGPLSDISSMANLPSVDVTSVQLPKNSRICLMNIHIFEAGLEAAELATAAIAQRFCTCNVEVSVLLIKLALKRLQHIVKDWTWNPAETVVITFVRLLVKINDGLHSQRVEELISGEYGLLTAIMNERSTNRMPGGFSHSTSYDARPLSHRYLDFLQDFYVVQYVQEYIDARSDTLTDFRWLKSQIGVTLVGSTSNLAMGCVGPLYDECKRSVVVIAGAGMWEVDGTYNFHSMFKKCGLFRKQGKLGREAVVYSLYRCAMDNGELRWYISIVPENSEPGSTADIDFYCCSVLYEEGSPHDTDPRPPSANWEAVEAKYEPAPSVIWTYDGSEESDREDSMAVADDDDDLYNSGSIPGTPRGGSDTP